MNCLGVGSHSSACVSLFLGSITRAGLSYNNIFEEIPIKVSNNSLVKAFLAELEGSQFLDQGITFERFSDVSNDSFLEKGTPSLCCHHCVHV